MGGLHAGPAASGQEVGNQDHDGHDQEQVDGERGDVERYDAEQPQHSQNRGDNQQHEDLLGGVCLGHGDAHKFCFYALSVPLLSRGARHGQLKRGDGRVLHGGPGWSTFIHRSDWRVRFGHRHRP